MGALDGLGEFAQGAAQGVGTGLDLYDRYQGIQDKKIERDKKARLDQYFTNAVANGEFDDPAVGMQGAAQFALENNMFDEYNKFYSASEGLKKSKLQRTGMQFQSVLFGSDDPSPAIPILNQFSKEAGLGVEYAYRPTAGGGGELITTQGGKSTSRAFKDPNELKVNLVQVIEPSMFDDYGDYAKVSNDRIQTQAQAASDRASALKATEEARYVGDKAKADIAQSQAAGQAALAQAGAAQTNAATNAALAPSAIDLRKAQTGYYESQRDDVTNTLKALFPAPDGYMDPPTPENNPEVIAPIAEDIKGQNGISANESIGISRQLLGGAPLNVKPDGSVVVAGKAYKLTSAQLQAVLNARAAPPAEE